MRRNQSGYNQSEYQNDPSTNERRASGTSELRAIAEEAWDFGAHALHAARDLFTGRRTPKTREGDTPDDGYQQGRSGGRSAGPREQGAYSGDYGSYGGREAGQRRQRGAYAAQGYARGYEDDDYDAGAWPSAGRRDYGPAGYGSGASFQRDIPRSYGARGQSEEGAGYAGQGGRGFGESYGYGQGERGDGRAAGESGYNERWENAYRGPAYESPRARGQRQPYPGSGHEGASYRGPSSEGRYYGGDSGYASPQHQGYGREGRRGLGPKNYTRSDERIREDISERLADDDQLDASNIEVQVSQGVVTLTGTVDERWEKHRAEDIADHCSGVRDVHNQIRVGQASTRVSSLSPQSAGGSTLGASASGASGAGMSTAGSTAGGSTTGGSTAGGSTTGGSTPSARAANAAQTGGSGQTGSGAGAGATTRPT